MDDAEAVLAAQRGDPSAKAAIYDRYADRLYDFSLSTLGNPAEAGEVLEETFLVAFDAIDRLHHPTRLATWLYAIAHRVALDRAGSRTSPASGRDTDIPLPPSARGEPATSRAELIGFARQQAGVLSETDLALLDLDLRQGLAGDDLADAVGMTTAQAQGALSRLRAQVERSLGALVVARTNRRECAAMAQLLTASGGRLTPGLREQIIRHVDDCETCNSRRRMVRPLSLLAAAPVEPAPAWMRDAVLAQADRAAVAGFPASDADWDFDPDGFPDQGGTSRAQAALPTRQSPLAAPRPPRRARREPPTQLIPAATTMHLGNRSSPGNEGSPRDTPRPPWRRAPRLAMAAVAIAISLIVAVMLIVASGHGHRPKVTVAATGSGPGVVASTTTPPDTITITTGPGSSTSAGPSTTGLPTTTMLQPGHFVVGATKLDFGTTVPSLSLVVSNDGAGGLSFTASSPSSQVAVSPGSGTIDPSSSKTLTVTLDRNSAPPGPFSSTVAITSPTGTAIVAIAAMVDPGPTVSGELAVPAEIRQANGALCLVPTANASSVTARITAPVTINPGQVVLHWQSTPATGSRPMSFNGSTATATLGPFSTTGLVDWWVTATDTAGISGSSAHHQVTVSCRVV